MIKNLNIDDILFNSDLHEINNKITSHKKHSSPGLEEEVTKFINDTCTILEKLSTKELSANECLVVIKNNFNKIKSSRQSTVTNHILNNVFNLLYEKFILIIIYICKNNLDQQVIQSSSNLIYNVISHIYHHLFSLNNKNDTNQNNQNRLLIHVWDILLLLIYSKDKRLRTNTCVFLHHFVYNCCLDEIVINSDLYHKHIKHILNLFLTNVTSSGVGSSGASSKDKLNLCIILVKLLQSFQSDEVMTIFLTIVNNTIDKHQTGGQITSVDTSNSILDSGEMEIVYAILEIIDIVDINVLQRIITLVSSNVKLNVTVYKKLYSYLNNIGILNLLYIFYNFKHLSKNSTNPTLTNVPSDTRAHNELTLEFNKMMLKWVRESGLDKFINYLLNSTLQINIIVFVLYNFFDHVTHDSENPDLKNLITNENDNLLVYLYGNDQIVNLLMKLQEKLENPPGKFDSNYKLYVNELNLILLSFNTDTELSLFRNNSHLGRLSFTELVTNNPEMAQDVKNILFQTLAQINISYVMKCLIDEYVQMNSSALDFITVTSNLSIFNSDNIVHNISNLLLQSFDYNITSLLESLDNLAVDVSTQSPGPGNLCKLVVIYVYFNYYNNSIDCTDVDTVNDIFNNYIIHILQQINSENSTDSQLTSSNLNSKLTNYQLTNSQLTNSKINMSKEEEFLVNVMVMKCIYVYNVMMNTYHDKVISIYYNILNNNIQMFNNGNNVFTYKLEVLLSIIIDLLYNKRDSSEETDGVVTTGSATSGSATAGLSVELKVYRLILSILTYDLRINSYIRNLILTKLVYKLLLVLSIRNDNIVKSADQTRKSQLALSSVNDMLKDYFICILEMILFDDQLNSNAVSILYTTIFNLYNNNTVTTTDTTDTIDSTVGRLTRGLVIESIKYVISNSIQYFIMNVDSGTVSSFSSIISRLKILLINCTDEIIHNVTILLILFVNYKMNVMEIYDIIKWTVKPEFSSELSDLYSLLHFYSVNISGNKKLYSLISSVRTLVNPKTNTVPNVRHIQTITEKYNMNNDPSPFCRFLFNQ